MKRFPAFLMGLTLLSATLPGCAPVGERDPGEIRESRKHRLPEPGEFRAWERGEYVAGASRRVLTATDATALKLGALADETNPFIAIPAGARLRQAGGITSATRPMRKLFEKKPDAAPTLTMPKEKIRLELYRPDFPGVRVVPENQSELTAGFESLENAKEMTESDAAALTHAGAVFGRAVRPKGIDLVVMPDGVLTGADAPKEGIWRLATSHFADAARKEFARHCLSEKSRCDPLQAAVFAKDAGLISEAQNLLKQITENNPPGSLERSGALFLLHEIDRKHDEHQSVKILEDLVFEDPEYEFVKNIGFWRLASFYNREHMWPETLGLYRGPGAALQLLDSKETQSRLRTIDFALAESARWKEKPEDVDHDQKIDVFHAYERLGDYETALVWVNRVIEENMPDRPEFLIEKGRCLLKIREYEQAERALKIVLADKENFYSKSGKIYESFIELYRAQARDAMVKWAEDMYDKQSEIYRGNPENKFASREGEDVEAPGRTDESAPQDQPGAEEDN